ncbi:MAG TPA: hypothetical protein VES19_03485 [Candidatus Limnocylindrales bacterium]|nr:hypothetical protein [Candidatus Limnocylindrales bacterium]
MKRFGKFATALALAICAITASSGLAMAGSTNYTSPNVWGSAIAFGNYATYYAKWSATRTITTTGTTWTISNFEMDALIRGGRGCDPSYCSAWGWKFTASFLDTNGTPVKSITLPAGRCYALPLISNTSLWLTRCQTSLTFKTKATTLVQLGKVNLSWAVGVSIGGYGYVEGWKYAKTLTFS